jgi:hypothetical protein
MYQPGHFELPQAVDLDNDWRLQRALNASSDGGGDPYVRFPLPGLSAHARTAAALDAAGQANRNFVRASTCADTHRPRGLRTMSTYMGCAYVYQRRWEPVRELGGSFAQRRLYRVPAPFLPRTFREPHTGVYKALEHLWGAMEATEVETGRRYTYTLVVRDDADWLAPMDLNRLLASRPDAHGFALSCDARVPPLHPSEINDHAMLLTRERAHLLGRFYSTVILSGQARACRVQKRSGVHLPCWERDGVASRRGQPCLSSCNSEELMRYALNLAGLRIHLVGQALLPFERSSHILVPPYGSGRTARCFHKLCQSHKQPLPTPPGRSLCSTLNLW